MAQEVWMHVFTLKAKVQKTLKIIAFWLKLYAASAGMGWKQSFHVLPAVLGPDESVTNLGAEDYVQFFCDVPDMGFRNKSPALHNHPKLTFEL